MSLSTVESPRPVELSAVRPAARRRVSARLLDLAVALPLCVLLSGVGMVAAWGWLSGSLRCRWTARVGRGGRTFDELRFEPTAPRHARLASVVGRLPRLWHVLAGDLALVGPRPLAPDDALWQHPRALERLAVTPGLVSLHFLRKQANVGYQDEPDDDAEYAARASLRTDLGILARAACLVWFGTTAEPAYADEVRILGLRIDNLTLRQAVDALVAALDEPDARHAAFVNADCANLACRHAEYRDVLLRAEWVLADGVGLRLAGKLGGTPIRENVNGTDLFPRLAEALDSTGHGVFLLGGKPGVAEGVRDWLARHAPGVDVRGWHHGYFTPAEEARVIDAIAASGARLLLVAFGAPRQDCWIARHLAELGNVRVAIGVGGLFDFYSGRMPRAPQWMRELGLEWLFRLVQEPGRLWKRYLIGNGVFLARVLWDVLRGPRA